MPQRKRRKLTWMDTEGPASVSLPSQNCLGSNRWNLIRRSQGRNGCNQSAFVNLSLETVDPGATCPKALSLFFRLYFSTHLASLAQTHVFPMGLEPQLLRAFRCISLQLCSRRGMCSDPQLQ